MVTPFCDVNSISIQFYFSQLCWLILQTLGVAVYKINVSIELIFKFECEGQVNHFLQVKILLFYTGKMYQICRFVNYFLGHQHESGGGGDEFGREARHELLGYFKRTLISSLSVACILVKATCMSMYELTQSFQSHAIYFAWALGYISTRCFSSDTSYKFSSKQERSTTK